MTLIVPKNFGITKLCDFLKDTTFIFSLENKKLPDFTLDLHRLQDASLLGHALLYKFVSYTAEHHCFEKPTIKVKSAVDYDIFKKYGFYEIIIAYIEFSQGQKEEKINKSYKNIKCFKDKDNNLFIAPQRLLRREETQKNSLEELYFSEIQKYYRNDKIFHLVSSCIGELITNFWAHATHDTGTIIAATCQKNAFEICLIDNGEGIITSLKSAYKDFSKYSNQEILLKSLEKGVSSKKNLPNSPHMGKGLYIIKNICKYNNGIFLIASEDSFYSLNNKQEIVKISSFWKGTIVYLRVNLDKFVGISEIPELKSNIESKIIWR